MARYSGNICKVSFKDLIEHVNNANNHNGETIDLAEKCEGKPNTFLCNFSGKPEKIEAFNGVVFYAMAKSFGEMFNESFYAWIYFAGSPIEVKNYSVAMTLTSFDKNIKRNHEGPVFSMNDSFEKIKGKTFSLTNDDVEKFEFDSKDLNITVTIRNLKEEAKDDDVESGASGTD